MKRTLAFLALGFLGAFGLHAQSLTNLFREATVMQLGAVADHVIGVSRGTSNFVWFGFGWMTNGLQQGRRYLANGASEVVPSARDGVVAGICGDYSIVTSNGVGLFGTGDHFARIPVLPAAGAMTPVSVNALGTVVGFTFSSTPFACSNGVAVALSTPNHALGSATGINDAGVIVGHLFPTNGIETAAVVWESGGCRLLCTQQVASLALCITDTRIGGSVGGKACWWEKVGGQWQMNYVPHYGTPLQGEILAMSAMGYLGGTLADGRAFLGKIGESNAIALAGQFGLPTSAQSVVGIAVSAGKLAVAVDCPDQAWGILTSLTPELPKLSVCVEAANALRVSWPTTPGVVLQTSLALEPAVWADWMSTYAESGVQTYVEVSPTNACGLFRLRSN